MSVLLTERPQRLTLRAACDALGLPRSSVYYRRQRVQQPSPGQKARTPHPRALSAQEREAVLALLNSPRYAEQPPAQVYASELDEGNYLCSIRTMQRILKDNAQSGERRPQREPVTHAIPRLVARQPNDVWTWDITKCATLVPGVYLSLYVIMDLFSRYVVAWMISRRENSLLARQLIEQSMQRYDIAPGQLTVHQDRGAPMTANQFIEMLIEREVTPSHSRPRVSNDNPFIESHFRTGKSQPDYPGRFAHVEAARGYWHDFFSWYNNDHHHRGIALYTPAQVFTGTYRKVHHTRVQTLANAYAQHPERFVRGKPTPPVLPMSVLINPVELTEDPAAVQVNYPTLTKVRERLSLH